MRRLALVLVVISLLAGAGTSQAEDHQAGPSVELQTAYLAAPLLGAHVLRTRGHLGGVGVVELDPNGCEVDLFGDPRACTEMATKRVPVKFLRAKLADPSGRERRLYLLAGAFGEGHQLFLVMPKKTEDGPARLILGHGDTAQRVITLEALVERGYGNAGVLCPEATYTAWQGVGGVTIRAKGSHPELGWRTWFQPQPAGDGVPQFALRCQRPRARSVRPSALLP